MTPFPAELAEGINSVVAPVSLLCTDVRSICCPPSTWSVWVDWEYSCRAFRRDSWNPANSSAVRFSRRDRIWSSLRTESVIIPVVRPASFVLSLGQRLCEVRLAARSGPDRVVCTWLLLCTNRRCTRKHESDTMPSFKVPPLTMDKEPKSGKMASQASRRLPWLCTNVLESNVKRGEHKAPSNGRCQRR